MKVPSPIYLFRITHIRNLIHVLENGLWVASASKANPDFTPIGDSQIIGSRKPMKVNVPPGGFLSDYIPFYFGVRSPMLYVIKNGYNDVKQYSQKDIVYLVTSFETIKDVTKWIFTDGNARDYSSQHFNQEEALEKLDWATIKSDDWSNREDDIDRKRRKQAEFLIKEHLPASCLTHIIVYDPELIKFAEELALKNGLQLKVAASPKYYY